MIDWTEIAFEALPALLGLAIVLHVFYRISRMEHFFEVVRSWIVLLFVVSLAGLWSVELITDTMGNSFDDLHIKMGMTFVIFSSWLSVCVVLLWTTHGRYNDVDMFVPWFKKNPLNLISAWGILGIVLVAMTWASDLSPETILESQLWLMVLVSIYILAMIASNLLLSAKWMTRGSVSGITRETRISLALFTVAWLGTPAVEFVFDLVLGVGRSWENLNPHNWILVLLFATLMRATFTSQLMAIVVDPEVETAKMGGFRSYDIPRGVYLVYDEKADAALSLFSELVTMPLRPDAEIPGREESAAATLQFLIPSGLVVTREFPEGIRKRHNLQVTPIIWLTESPGERRIAPTSLAVLTDTIIRFMESNPNSIVVVEGIEYIVTYNDFRKVLRSLDSLNETAWVTKGRLLLAVNPKAFEERDLALLERDRKVLSGTGAVDELKKESRIAGIPA
ncbi:MAG: DUF835 domain-containing protein [Thermoplasmatota archaeon]|nr:DUF835 domain-containing protein [Candidatus Thermoplasmatota archaeon]MBU1915254.1 DUF835 domain-containing protein [Candidatus Thermoplasmatota archaeon]